MRLGGVGKQIEELNRECGFSKGGISVPVELVGSSVPSKETSGVASGEASQEQMPGRGTKIVATIGPASGDSKTIRALISAGMNCARINASHGDHKSRAQLIDRVRAEAVRLGQPVTILMDLQGPKIRTGEFAGAPRRVCEGEEFTIVTGSTAADDEIPTNYALLDQDVKEGDPLLIDDGHLETRVIAVSPGRVQVRALNDHAIDQRKGINLPASFVSAPSLTEKDRDDIAFAVSHKVDVVALSFVRRAADVEAVRDVMREHGGDLPIIAKIEKPQALDNLKEILEVSWGVMVARGDLGVEMSPEHVPVIQKQIIAEAQSLRRPVITATQMLESMCEHPRPTRAEASDVANAVLDGTDAVMLSAETAIGRYPVESVEMMNRIIEATESCGVAKPHLRRQDEQGTLGDAAGAVADAACRVIHFMRPLAVVAFTQSGQSAQIISQRRPDAQIWAFTPSVRSRNLLSLVWGVHPYLLPNADTSESLIRELDCALLAHGLADLGDNLVVLMRAPVDSAVPNNIMLVHSVGETFEI